MPIPVPASSTAIGLNLPNQAGDGGGQAEDAAADDGIDHQRSEAPAADGANQLLAASAVLWERVSGIAWFYHKVRERYSAIARLELAERLLRLCWPRRLSPSSGDRATAWPAISGTCRRIIDFCEREKPRQSRISSAVTCLSHESNAQNYQRRMPVGHLFAAVADEMFGR